MKLSHIAYRGSLFYAISHRAALATEMAQKVRLAQESENRLMEELLKLTPSDLKSFVDNSGILSTLFRYGHVYEKIVFNGDQGFGFGNSADVKSKLKKLAKAWGGVVKIDADFDRKDGDDEDGRTEVRLSAFI